VDREHTLSAIIDWARSDGNIRAVVLTGSAARGDADEWSDLDIEIYAVDPSRLLEDASWYARFGKVLAVEALANPGWHPTRLLYLVDGKIDFMIAPVSGLDAPRDAAPFRLLIDKDGNGARLTTKLPASDGPPDAAEVLRCINWFYAAALMCAKAIVRGEMWTAKVRDWDLKQQLLLMIEWDHRARYGWGYETWRNGQRIAQWADDDVKDALQACWGRFDSPDMTHALIASIDLFDELATRGWSATQSDGFDAAAARAEVVRILSRNSGNRVTQPGDIAAR
jgi:aminoglycoside 6-adenylyltransferase